MEMELRRIERDYGVGNFKFFFKFNKYNKKHYESLLENEKYNEMKNIYIPHCEDRLHVTATYLYFTKYIIPIFLLSTFFIFSHGSLLQLLFPSIGILISLITHLILKKWWILRCQMYSFEVTAINMFMSKKYDIEVDNDFDELGEKYIKGEL